MVESVRWGGGGREVLSWKDVVKKIAEISSRNRRCSHKQRVNG